MCCPCARPLCPKAPPACVCRSPPHSPRPMWNGSFRPSDRCSETKSPFKNEIPHEADISSPHRTAPPAALLRRLGRRRTSLSLYPAVRLRPPALLRLYRRNVRLQSAGALCRNPSSGVVARRVDSRPHPVRPYRPADAEPGAERHHASHRRHTRHPVRHLRRHIGPLHQTEPV